MTIKLLILYENDLNLICSGIWINIIRLNQFLTLPASLYGLMRSAYAFAWLLPLTALCTGLINISFLTAKPLSKIAAKHMTFNRFFDIWHTILDIELVMLIDLLICLAIIILS